MTLCGFFLTVLIAIVAAVWAVGAIRTTTAVLGTKIEGLQHAIERMANKHDGVEARVRFLEDAFAKAGLLKDGGK